MTTDPRELLNLTNSEAQDFLDCKRRWYLGVYRKLGRTNEHRFNTAQSIGIAYHAAMASYYGDGVDLTEFATGYYGEKIIEITSTLDELTANKVLDDLDKEASLVSTMLEGYKYYLEEEGEDEDLDVFGAEEKIVVPLIDGRINAMGKIDARARYRTSPEILLQLEHKTTGSFTDLEKVAQKNPQFLNYDLLAFLKVMIDGTGERTDGVLLNMARKVKRTVKAKPPFFKRHEVRHNEHELRAHWRAMVGIGKEIHRTYERLDAGEDHHEVCPPRPVPDCTWKCPFALPCLSGMLDDGSDFDGFAAMAYVERDPLERYLEIEKVKDEDGSQPVGT